MEETMTSHHQTPKAQKDYSKLLGRAKRFLDLDYEMIQNMPDLQARVGDVIDGGCADNKMLRRAKMLWSDIAIARQEEAAR